MHQHATQRGGYAMRIVLINAYPPLIPTQSWAKRISVLTVGWYLVVDGLRRRFDISVRDQAIKCLVLAAPEFSDHCFTPQPLTMSQRIASSSLLMVTASAI